MDTAKAKYDEAKKVAGKNARALKRMALHAWKNRKDPEAIEAMQSAWERNTVQPYIHAVDAYPDLFAKGDKCSTDAYLSLFAICTLNKFDRAQMLSEWGSDLTMELWQVLERVKELKTPKPREKKTKTCPHCGLKL